jgi:acetyltransferase-like isoleucine patch superfamily enzyme
MFRIINSFLRFIFKKLDSKMLIQYNRSLPSNEYLNDRWIRSKKLGFGINSSIYDNSYVYGDVKVGKETWIGPYTIIDGTGKLLIGNYCTISAGVHIYTHDNLKATLTGKTKKIERSHVEIGINVYVGPKSIIAKGVKIGNNCVVAAGSFVNKSFEDNSIIGGIPAKKIGYVNFENNDVNLNYN